MGLLRSGADGVYGFASGIQLSGMLDCRGDVSDCDDSRSDYCSAGSYSLVDWEGSPTTPMFIPVDLFAC